MDLARGNYRRSYGATEHSLAGAISLAHLRALEQHRAQQQERRVEPGRVHRAANYLDESGNPSALDSRPLVVVRLARRPPLSTARNYLSGSARRIHYFAWQKLLSRACVSDALCGGWPVGLTPLFFSARV